MSLLNENMSRIIRAYVAYHLRRNSKWPPKVVSYKTPKHICEFITQKCGLKEKGFEGRKVYHMTSIWTKILYSWIVLNSYLNTGCPHILVPLCSASWKCHRVALWSENWDLVSHHHLESFRRSGLTFLQLWIANKIASSIWIYDGTRENQSKGWRDI